MEASVATARTNVAPKPVPIAEQIIAPRVERKETIKPLPVQSATVSKQEAKPQEPYSEVAETPAAQEARKRDIRGPRILFVFSSSNAWLKRAAERAVERISANNGIKENELFANVAQRSREGEQWLVERISTTKPNIIVIDHLAMNELRVKMQHIEKHVPNMRIIEVNALNWEEASQEIESAMKTIQEKVTSKAETGN